jgi:nicotinate-nucleotide pyrophosphorylase (carboxylating)
LTTELRRVKSELAANIKLEVEVDRLEQIPSVLAAGVDIIMLDNFEIDEMKKGVELINGACVVEASGGVNLETVADIAKTGVDVISVGALTHSARALDLALDVEIN